ncbi:transposase [Accumulibacter sp.]|uniref:transposase n=1 Tax=Accumulibacter sp. TaxID=2053492 RepID=UPI0004B07378|nr:transposase [Accumulibacter sp.]HRF05473.1 transposase [Accumulibacter sp.]
MQRGHNRNACFLSEGDYLAYLDWLDDALRQTGCQLQAYVLMTNHVHLLVTPEKADAILGVLISLGRRTGTLWDSR